jgi:hypothetical protein
MSLSKDFKEFIECLNKRGVEYLLVKGHAVAFHEWPRLTKDNDFWIRPTPENARRMLQALSDFGFEQVELGEEDFTTEGKIVRLGVPPNRIDLVTSIDGVDFDKAWERRVKSEYAGERLLVIHRDDLITNKKATGREQDALDLKALLTKTE